MAEEASALLSALTAQQRARICAPANDRVGRHWYFTPAERDGVALADLSPRAQQNALRLLRSGLSEAGFALATYILGLENLLACEEGWMEQYPGRPGHGRSRDPQLYFVKIFGDPADETWGWQFAGHHLVAHAFVEDGRVASLTPHFIGVNPAAAPSIGRNQFRPLAGEEQIAIELVAGLNGAQRQRAVFSSVAPSDILQQNRPLVDDAALPSAPADIYPADVPREEVVGFLAGLGIDAEAADAAPDGPEIAAYAATDAGARGVRVAELDPAGRELASELLAHYVERFPEDVRHAVFGWEPGEPLPADLRFAWAGSPQQGSGRYYCLDSANLTIEFDNTQNRANHIHSALRSRRSDFASDILRAHYLAEHPN
ncbi:hypothetical protein B4915_12905 [Leucobacter massiliensis]|uniref:DUF3500 domain-containing protein n=2 Tax=Leucobacter massiliensis TaxID=1686285 RepID=A0A2S9QL22_9MICO|nr:hypothetical protein B4915_12905 [Leucobacter massiliensis]